MSYPSDDESFEEVSIQACPTCERPMTTPFQLEISVILDCIAAIDEAVKNLKSYIEEVL